MKDSPAFPETRWDDIAQTTVQWTGMTIQQYAAIHLLQPTSGLDWLDDMIRARMRDEFAGMALSGLATRYSGPDAKAEDIAMIMADAMMKEREER